MIILDTDLVSLLEWRDSPEARALSDRLEAVGAENLWVTVVSFEEQTRGWLSLLAKAKRVAQEVEAYARLLKHLQSYRRAQVLPFDEPAAVKYQELRSSRIRIGAMDLKIASIALANGAMLLTRNLSDFAKVPGLRAEDWTR